MLRSVRVGPCEQEDVVRELRLGRPDLLAVDDPLVAVELCAGLERGEVASGIGLGESLAPCDRPVEDPRDERLLLLLGSPLKDRRARRGCPRRSPPEVAPSPWRTPR